MNRHIFKAMLCAALALPALTGCELDQYPADSLPTERSWEKLSDAATYDTGLLAVLRSANGGSNAYVSEIQADLFNACTGAASLNLVHSWDFTAVQFDGDVVWADNYSLISNANNIINNIGKIAAETEEDAAALNIYKGTAYFARALGYANMVTRYCKNYDAATADTELGLPLVVTVDVTQKPNRSSLAQTYKFIKADIDSARKYLAGLPESTDRPSLDATTALEARVSLQTGDYDKAIANSRELIAKYPLAATADEFANMWLYDEGSEIIYQPVQTVDERTSAYSTIYIDWNAASGVYNPYYIPTQGLLDLYEPADMRFSAYFSWQPLSALQNVEAAYVFMKYPGNPNLKKNGPYEFYNMTKVFRAAEFYLTAAEASYRLNGTDGGFLNALRTARGASALDHSGEALWQDIKDEWAREMVGEGFRLDCLKRWGDGCKRMTPQAFSNFMLITQQNYTNLDIPAGYFKFVWEIPSQDTQANTNLIKNWSTAE